jgi:hypothetical protein
MFEALDALCQMFLALITKKDKLTPEDRRMTRNVIVVLLLIIIVTFGWYFFRKQH